MSSKVVLVTGGTQGIGEAISHNLADKGWTVILSGRNAANGEKVVESITAKGGKASFIKSDISIESDVQSLHAQIVEKHGHLDAAVNNAGIASEFGKIADISTAQLENMYKVNVFGVFWSMQAQVKAMLAPRQGEDGEKGKGRGGRIVNIASVAGLNGLAANGVYASTKHAVIGLTRSAALDYAKDAITVNAVAPATIRTPLVENAIAANTFFTEEALVAAHPIGRIGEVEDVAKAVAFLLDSPWVTGSVVVVDGGYGAQ